MATTPAQSKDLFPWMHRDVKMLIAGGLAGAVSRTSVAPLEVVKIVMQVQDVMGPGAGGERVNSISHGLKLIYKRDGIRGYFKGNGTNVTRIIPYSATQFLVYDKLKPVLLAPGESQLSGGNKMLAGAIAGVASVIITYPLDLVRGRITVQTADSAVKYRGIWHALTTIARVEGAAALWSGMVPTVLGIAPYMAMNFFVYETLKYYDLSRTGSDKQTVGMRLLCGGIAGAAAQTAAYPFDLLRRRYQMQGVAKGLKYDSLWHAFQHVVKTEGVTGLYKGLTPNYAKVVPTMAVSFAVFEEIKDFLGCSDVQASHPHINYKMDRARRAMPTGNPIVTAKWDAHVQELHRDRMKKIKPVIDTAPPNPGTHLKVNGKKFVQREENFRRIEAENKILLRKMAAILRSSKTLDTVRTQDAQSLNRFRRRVELERITKENQRILQRIQQSEPTYNHYEWEEQRRQNERLLRSISTFDRSGKPKAVKAVEEEARRAVTRPQSAPAAKIAQRAAEAKGRRMSEQAPSRAVPSWGYDADPYSLMPAYHRTTDVSGNSYEAQQRATIQRPASATAPRVVRPQSAGRQRPASATTRQPAYGTAPAGDAEWDDGQAFDEAIAGHGGSRHHGASHHRHHHGIDEDEEEDDGVITDDGDDGADF